jgi:RND family efflux transporter MFP subunit
VLVLLMMTGLPGTHRIKAEATVEGLVQRAIVAGLDGYVAEARARAGDLVARGQVLARLDDRDLVLEHRRWEARENQLRHEYRSAVALHDRSELSIAQARLDEARAQIALLDEQLARTRLVAPFDGIVVRGDLSQSLGAPVERGDVLYEIAPIDGYRIIIEVDERDIAHVDPGRRGALALTALPGAALPLEIRQVTPVSIAEGGRNFFRVEASLDEPYHALRPGMEGVARIDAGRHRLLWIWTHELVDWLRLQAWSLLP